MSEHCGRQTSPCDGTVLVVASRALADVGWAVAARRLNSPPVQPITSPTSATSRSAAHDLRLDRGVQLALGELKANYVPFHGACDELVSMQ